MDDDREGLADAFLNAFNAHDVPRLETLLSETFLDLGPQGPVGIPGWRKRIREHFEEYPDSALTDARVSVEGETFVIEALWTGTRAADGGRTRGTNITYTGLIKEGKLDTLRISYDRVVDQQPPSSDPE